MKLLRLGAFALAATTLGSAAAAAADEVNVYSYRQPFLMKPLFDAFTDKTGITVNTVFAKKGLIERLKAEDHNTPADLVFTADVGRLNQLVDEDLVRGVETDTLTAAVPDQYRHPDGKWYGLTLRGRVIYASEERVPEGAIDSYADLAKDRWEGRVCTRKGDHVYQVSLLASIIAHEGEEAAREWIEAVKGNLARKPQGNDRAQVKAISEGVCDLSLGNTYYMGKMQTNPDQAAWAEAARIVFPDQDGRGTHVNVSGAAVTRHAPNAEGAVELLEFMVSDTAQQIYAEQNFEYPVKPGVPWSGLLKTWGDFKADSVDLAEVAGYRDEALRLVHEVGYNR